MPSNFLNMLQEKKNNLSIYLTVPLKRWLFRQETTTAANFILATSSLGAKWSPSCLNAIDQPQLGLAALQSNGFLLSVRRQGGLRLSANQCTLFPLHDVSALSSRRRHRMSWIYNHWGKVSWRNKREISWNSKFHTNLPELIDRTW